MFLDSQFLPPRQVLHAVSSFSVAPQKRYTASHYDVNQFLARLHPVPAFEELREYVRSAGGVLVLSAATLGNAGMLRARSKKDVPVEDSFEPILSEKSAEETVKLVWAWFGALVMALQVGVVNNSGRVFLTKESRGERSRAWGREERVGLATSDRSFLSSPSEQRRHGCTVHTSTTVFLSKTEIHDSSIRRCRW